MGRRGLRRRGLRRRGPTPPGDWTCHGEEAGGGVTVRCIWRKSVKGPADIYRGGATLSGDIWRIAVLSHRCTRLPMCAVMKTLEMLASYYRDHPFINPGRSDVEK